MQSIPERLKKRLFSAGLCIVWMLAVAASATAGIEEHIVKTETGFYYTVQKGDTLWDLSEKFADSPWLWPDLWHYNPQIPNPHLIYPGQKIRVYRKAFHGRKPAVAEKAPEPEKPERFFTYSPIDAVGFIRKQPVDSLGTIFLARRQHALLSTGDTLYVRPEPGRRISAGETYFIYRNQGPVDDPATGEYIGDQYLLTGVIEITEAKTDFAAGVVARAFCDIQKGDRIMPFYDREEKIRLKAGIETGQGHLIKSEGGWNFIGEDTVAFINRGRSHGIEVGQQYEILYEVTDPMARPSEKSVLTREEVGSLMVLHVEEQTATVLITDSREDLKAGMPLQARALTAAPR